MCCNDRLKSQSRAELSFTPVRRAFGRFVELRRFAIDRAMKITYFDLVNSALMVVAMICIFVAGLGLYGNPFTPVTVGLRA